MGLDWCVRDKNVPEQATNLLFAEAQLDKLRKELTEAYNDYATKNEVRQPAHYPNDVQDAFSKTTVAMAIQEKINTWHETRGVCVISPMETLGAPRVGVDKKATSWARKYYKDLVEDEDFPKDRKKVFMDRYPTVKDYLTANHDRYVIELVPESAGVSGITGFATGPESFRGKCLRYITWLPETLQNEAYDDHEPEDLIGFGERLIVEADLRLTHSEGANDELFEDDITEVDLVKMAGNWCIFWGERGHGMHAWY